MTEDDDLNHEQMCFNFLDSNSFLAINKRMIECFGLDAAAFLADLISKNKYFKSVGKITEDGYFFNTQDNRQKDTGLTPFQQRKAITTLKELEIINTCQRDMPSKLYFKIEFSCLITQLLRNFTTRSEETSQLEVKKLHISYNKNKSNNNKSNLSFNFVKDKDASFSDKNDFSLVLKSNNPSVYIIIEYWNSLNIRKHNITKQTKTIDLIINSINTLLKKYTIEDILESFKTYKYIIDLYPKKFRKGSLYFVGLNDFIRYNKNTLKFVDHIPVELQSIKGLFEICVKGNDYAKVYFKPIIFAKDSKLAKIIETNFINTLGQNKVIGKETLIEKITNLFIRFYDTNLAYFNFTAADRKSKTTIVNWMFDYIDTKNKFEVHFAAREPFFIDFGNWLIEEAMMKE